MALALTTATTTEVLMSSAFIWNGHGLPGSCPTVTVRYQGPTNTRGSRWSATLKRDRQTTYRASVPYDEGPVAAFNALRRKHVAELGDWTLKAAGVADQGDTYFFLCGF